MKAWILFGATLFVSTAFAAEPTRTGDTTRPQTTTDKPMGARVTQDEALGIALTANAAEVEYGMAMIGRATDPDVRAFAQRLIKDHGDSNTRLLSLIKPDGTIKPVNSAMRSRAFADANDQVDAYWSGDAGVELDRKFMTEMIADHAADLRDLDNVLLPAATNVEFKQALTSLRSSVADHLRNACSIGKRLGSDTKDCASLTDTQ